MREAADMLVGRHDFRSFMNENGEAQVGIRSISLQDFVLVDL